MTKQELHGLHGAEVINITSMAAFRAMLETAREGCPSLSSKPMDQVSIIRNEGMIQGWYDCITFMKGLGKPLPPAPEPRGHGPLYPDPEKISSDQNKVS